MTRQMSYDNVVNIFAHRAKPVAEPEEMAAEPEEPLFGGGGGGTSNDMEALDAKIAAAEARTDTKLSELGRVLDKVATKSDIAASQAATRSSIWTSIGVALGLILAVLAFAANRFDAGITAGGALAPYAAKQQQRDAAQDKKFDEILRRLPESDKPPGK